MFWVTGWRGALMSNVETAPTPRNDPKLLRQVYVKVIKPFCINGKPLSVGDEVAIEYHVARDMVALGKARLMAGQQS